MENSQQWLHGAAWKSDGNKNNNNVASGKRVDLTLKLGLPDQQIQCQNPMLYQYVNPVANSISPNHPSNLSFNLGPNTTTTQGMNPQLGMVNQGATSTQSQESLNGSQYAWPPSKQMESNLNIGGNMSYSSPPLSQYNSGLSSNGFLSPNSYPNFPPAPTNSYTLIDVPPSRATDLDLGGSAASAAASGYVRRGPRRQRVGTYNDPNKRCTNYNCNTNDTPMWRKGPLGPKTLCNACGIKYRKEEEKKKLREAGSSSSSSSRSRN